MIVLQGSDEKGSSTPFLMALYSMMTFEFIFRITYGPKSAISGSIEKDDCHKVTDNAKRVRYIIPDETEVFPSTRASHSENQSDVKTILFWTSYFGGYTYDFGPHGRESFIKAGCWENRCRTTSDRKMEEVADAIVFHN